VDPVLLGRGMAAPPDPTPPEVVRERFALADRRVVLCVSAALVHKNLDRLLDAFAGVLAADPDVQLVLVGHEGREYARLGGRATALGVADHVSFTGWISAADLEGLYAVAACCAYPSLYEGFGLPVLEAMARGVPLACSPAPSLPVVAGAAPLLFDPQDTASITAAILRVLDDPELAATLRARGLERAARFTWERCAEGVLAVYDQVLADARTR
jgi:glycosyltransferase involved in cell wall biosynthesis